jgi:hypothetical protein
MNTEIEPNGTAGTANSTGFGSVMAGTIDAADDEDWFSFSASAGDIIDAYTFAEEFGSPLDGFLTLYDTDGAAILAFNDDYENNDARILFAIPANGIYFLKAASFDDEQLGDYELSLTRLGAGNEAEPNNSIATANVISEFPNAKMGEIGQKDDSDFYAITVEACATIGIRVESIDDDASPDLVLAIFDAAGNLLAVNDDHLGGRYFTAELAWKNTTQASAVFYLQATTYQSQEQGKYVISCRKIASASNGTYYAALGDLGGGRFLTLDTNSGAGTMVDFTRFHGAAALAIDAAGEVVAARAGVEDTPLFMIDPGTGAGFGIAEIIDLENVQALAFDAQDELYAIDQLNQLYRVDLFRGEADFLFSLPDQGGQISGMALDPLEGKLYVAACNESRTVCEIWRADLATGSSVLVGATGLAGGAADLFFNRAGKLFSAKGGSDESNNFFEIDKNTGTGTVIGDIGYLSVDAMDAYPAYVHDIGIEAITAPDSGAALGTTERITVQLKNSGTIYKSNFELTYAIQGPFSISVTESTGSLIIPVGQTVAYTFAAPVDLSAAGTYTITVSAEVPNDSNTGNNVLSKTISGTTAIGDEPGDLLPSEFALYQNYPNPFNPSTMIGFQLPVAGEIRLAIYNMNGQLVRTLANGKYAAGNHTLLWDGTDGSGARVASGVYLYVIRAGGFVAQKKLVLMQ